MSPRSWQAAAAVNAGGTRRGAPRQGTPNLIEPATRVRRGRRERAIQAFRRCAARVPCGLSCRTLGPIHGIGGKPDQEVGGLEQIEVGCGSATSRPSSVWLTSWPNRRQTARIRRRKSGRAAMERAPGGRARGRFARSRRTRWPVHETSSGERRASGSRRVAPGLASLRAHRARQRGHHSSKRRPRTSELC